MGSDKIYVNDRLSKRGHDMKNYQFLSRIIVCCIPALVFGWPQPAVAQEGGGESAAPRAQASPGAGRYAQYFGDGLREFGEGDYARSIHNLMRAYALDSRAETLALVVAAYDKMGFCDAASRQIEVFRAAHSGEDAPQLARCTQAGAVKLECVGVNGPMVSDRVRVDGQFEVRCGQNVALPPGEHVFRFARGGAPRSARQTVGVQANRKVSLRLESFAKPTRWSAAGGTEVAQLRDFPTHVERVTDAGFGYTVFLTQDGIYRVFVQSAPADPPAYFDLPFRPNILRLCDSGERFDNTSRQCLPVKGMKIPKFK